MSWTRTLHDSPEGAMVMGWMMDGDSDGKNDNKQEQQAKKKAATSRDNSSKK